MEFKENFFAWSLGMTGKANLSEYEEGDNMKLDEALAEVATFSGKNMMDLLWGFPDVDEIEKPLGADDVKLLVELHHCFDNATVVEEMLVALLHMQVDVCYLRQGRRQQYNGMPAF